MNSGTTLGVKPRDTRGSEQDSCRALLRIDFGYDWQLSGFAGSILETTRALQTLVDLFSHPPTLCGALNMFHWNFDQLHLLWMLLDRGYDLGSPTRGNIAGIFGRRRMGRAIPHDTSIRLSSWIDSGHVDESGNKGSSTLTVEHSWNCAET